MSEDTLLVWMRYEAREDPVYIVTFALVCLVVSSLAQLSVPGGMLALFLLAASFGARFKKWRDSHVKKEAETTESPGPAADPEA